MKKIYLTLLLAVFTLVVSGQEVEDNQVSLNGDIVGFKLYPNPAFGDRVYITSKKNDSKDITVFDVFGEIVLRQRMITNVLNISKLVPGVYMMQITENSNTITRKLVVK